MAFCTYSQAINEDGYTLVDNTFINEFMPQAPAEFVKVYLYGLNLCTAANQDYNSADSAATFLGLSEDDILHAYEYWQELSLIQIISKSPLEVKYLPVKAHSGSAKIRAKGKYADFNKHVQGIITGRMIKPIEYNEYYNLIESQNFDPDALIMIIKYCTTLKGENVGYPYILTVAKSFAYDNIKSVQAVEEKLLEQEKSTKEIKQVLDALGIKRSADIDERNNYLKWTNNFGFTHGVIIEVAKTVKTGGFNRLDTLLTKYYQQHLFTTQEIAEYSALKDKMFEIAKVVSKNLGTYYQNLEPVVQTYIAPWLNMGYNQETLELVSKYCFIYSYRTFEAMDDVVNKFFKLGITTVDAIAQYTNEILKADNFIKEVLDACGLVRMVNSADRNFYKIWTENWGFSHEAILAVAQASLGKAGSISYINKILSSLNSLGKHSVQDVQNYMQNQVSNTKINKDQEYMHHEYTKEQLDAQFDSLDDIEV